MKQKILKIIAILSFMVSSVGAQTITMQELEYSSSVLGHKTITVKIADAAETTAVQMNLSLPEGYALTEEGIALSDASNDHIISVSPLASGDYLIVVYSLSQSTFKDGTLLVIPLSVDANAKNDEAVLHTMRTSTADAVSHAHGAVDHLRRKADDRIHQKLPQHILHAPCEKYLPSLRYHPQMRAITASSSFSTHTSSSVFWVSSTSSAASGAS